jgi:hypothetical protein
MGIVFPLEEPRLNKGSIDCQAGRAAYWSAAAPLG